MGTGALADVSRSISDVRVDLGQADFPLRMSKIHRYIPQSHHQTLCMTGSISHQTALWHGLKTGVLVCCDDDVAFGLAVVANALHSVDLSQLMDDFPVLSVHGLETVAPLWLFPLQASVKHDH